MTYYETIKQHVSMHEYSFVALSIFILLLTYSYTILALLYFIMVLAASIYLQPFSDMRLTAELISYFTVGFFIVFLAIPCIYIILTLLEPSIYIALTIFIVQYSPHFYTNKATEISKFSKEFLLNNNIYKFDKKKDK